MFTCSHLARLSHLVGPTWPDCLTWMSDRISPWLSHLTPSLEFLSYLGFVHLDGNVLNLQVQTGLWTLQFQLSIWVDAHFSWSKDRLENYKTKQWENDPFITEQHKPMTQTKPRTCSRTCGLYSQDQKTHCTGNEGGPCPYCWWNTLTPPAWGEGEEEGESRKRKKEGRSSLVRVQENFPKHSKMSIIFMDQTNWRFTTWSHNCLAFGIILFVWCSVIPPPSVESHWYFLLESFSDLDMAVQFPCVKSAHHFIQKRSFGTKK